MRGRFIFSDCGELKINFMDCRIVNSARSFDKNITESLNVSILAYDNGKIVGKVKDIIVPSGQFKSLKDEDVLLPINHSRNITYVVDISKGDVNDYRYFSQEHHIQYGISDSYASLLFDHQPYFANKDKFSSINVLAPKVVLAKNLNTYLVFNNARDAPAGHIQNSPMHITLLDTSGKSVYKSSFNLTSNATFIFDVKKYLPDEYTYSSEPLFFSFASKGGDSQFSIYTMIVNELTGSIAIEHSLPPMYYIKGDIHRVRQAFLSDRLK